MEEKIIVIDLGIDKMPIDCEECTQLCRQSNKIKGKRPINCSLRRMPNTEDELEKILQEYKNSDGNEKALKRAIKKLGFDNWWLDML